MSRNMSGGGTGEIVSWLELEKNWGLGEAEALREEGGGGKSESWVLVGSSGNYQISGLFVLP